ncbi:MAG: hypothetical protein ABIO48_05905 [Pedococcus sp.]
MVGDDYEPPVTDVTLLREIELLAEVMAAAAAQVEGGLTAAQLDHILGLADQEPAWLPE